MKLLIAVFGVAVVSLLLVFLFALLFAVPVMLLWDWLMPQLFGLGEITLAQAWGLALLVRLLMYNPSSSTKSEE